MLKRGEIPNGIRLLTWSTSARWFGWGLGEAFMPIFLLLFSASLFETGLLASVYNFVFFLFIPIAGFLADNIKIKKMIIMGLFLTILIGVGYFLAGVTGSIIFIIAARALNGVSYSLDRVARDSYFIRHSPKNKVSQMFGHFNMIGNFWWMLAIVIGLLFVKFMGTPIHWLLLAIAPTSIISFFIVLRLKEKAIKKKKKKPSIFKIYINIFRDIKKFNKEIKTLIFLAFVIGVVSSIIYFFVPISSYLAGNGLVSAALLPLFYTIPYLFGEVLGKIADKKKEKIYLFSLSSLILTLVVLIFFRNYFVMLLIMLFASVMFELISLTNNGVVARLADRTHLGETDSSLNGVAAVGAIVGPISFGLLMDLFGIANAYLITALFLVVSSFIILRRLRGIKG